MKFSKTILNLTALFVFCAQLSAQVGSLEIESLTSDDIGYVNSSIRYEDESLAELSVELNWNRSAIDYQSAGFPIDIVTADTERDEVELSFSIDTTFELPKRLTLTPSLTYSEGFNSHTSIWLDEYYRQLWSGRTINGDSYEDPSPRTIGAGLQLRWEYIPSNAFISGGISFADRVIAPGYEFAVEGERAGELVRGLNDLQTINFNLAFENNMNQRWRMVNSIVASDTTARNVRFTLEHQSFVAVSENWVIRSSLAHAREGGDFEANRINLRLIRELGFEWSVFAGIGFYQDNGEVEQANLATDAAPELESDHWITGIQWSSFDQSKTVSFSLGQYRQTYNSSQLDQRFQNLYSNRDWSLLKLSFTHTF